MARLVRMSFLFSLVFLGNAALALEVHQGDHFSGVSILNFLKQKVYNFENELCGQKTILRSSDHQAFIAIGAYLYVISFEKAYTDARTGKSGLIVTATYKDLKSDTRMTQDLGGCLLKD